MICRIRRYLYLHEFLTQTVKLLLEINHQIQQRIFLLKLSRFVRKEDEVGGEQRREGSFFIGSTVIEGNFGYYIKTNIPTIYILLCINKPIELSASF